MTEEARKVPKTAEEVAAQAGRITEKLVERASALGLEESLGGRTGDKTTVSDGTRITVNTDAGDQSGIEVTRVVAPDGSNDRYSAQVSYDLGFDHREGNVAQVGQGFRTATEHIGVRKDLAGYMVGRVESASVVEANRTEGYRHGELNTAATDITPSREVSVITYGSQQPVSPNALHNAAHTLSQIRGAVAAAEIAQQQPPQHQ